MENLTTLCGGHHSALHRHEIVITGKAPAIVVTRMFEVPHVGESKRSGHVDAGLRADAVLALTTLGFTKTEARPAVEAALDDDPESLEALVRGALRRLAVT